MLSSSSGQGLIQTLVAKPYIYKKLQDLRKAIGMDRIEVLPEDNDPVAQNKQKTQISVDQAVHDQSASELYQLIQGLKDRLNTPLAKALSSTRRGGIFNLSDQDLENIGLQHGYTPNEAPQEQNYQAAIDEINQKLKQFDQSLLSKLKVIQYDPMGPVSELDVEQHSDADELVKEWALNHPEFNGTLIARISGVDNNNAFTSEKGYHIRYGVIDYFPDFGAVTGPQRDKVLRRVGYTGPPSEPDLNMGIAPYALVKVIRDGRIGRLMKYSDENGYHALVSFLDTPRLIPFTIDELEPLTPLSQQNGVPADNLQKSLDRDAKGKFAFSAVNDPQPPKKDGPLNPDVLTPEEILSRVLQSRNHIKHLTERNPEDRTTWIERYKNLWVGDKNYNLKSIPLKDLNNRPVDLDSGTVRKYMKEFPTDRAIIIRKDPLDDNKYVVLDGNHLLESAKRRGEKEILAYEAS